MATVGRSLRRALSAAKEDRHSCRADAGRHGGRLINDVTRRRRQRAERRGRTNRRPVGHPARRPTGRRITAADAGARGRYARPSASHSALHRGRPVRPSCAVIQLRERGDVEPATSACRTDGRTRGKKTATAAAAGQSGPTSSRLSSLLGQQRRPAVCSPDARRLNYRKKQRLGSGGGGGVVAAGRDRTTHRVAASGVYEWPSKRRANKPVSIASTLLRVLCRLMSPLREYGTGCHSSARDASNGE